MSLNYEVYDRLKIRIKQRLPRSWYSWALPFIHIAEALVANLRYGFPARKMKFVGITGTNGKTTTAILIARILSSAGHTVGLSSTAVIQVADQQRTNDLGKTTANPFQIQKLLREMRRAKCDWVVMEVTSHALSQHRTWGIKFQVAVFTNLTRDHLNYHGTMGDYARTKGRLFAQDPDVMVLNRDDKWFKFFDRYQTEHQITYGIHAEADCRIVKARLALGGTKLKFTLDEHELVIGLHLPGRFNVYNAIAAAATTYAMDVPLQHIRKGLEGVRSLPGRMESIDEGQPFAVLVDYAHTSEALQTVLQSIRLTLNGRLIAVIGGDGGRDRHRLQPFGETAAKYSEVVIVTDQEPYPDSPQMLRAELLKGADKVKHSVLVKEIPDRREAISKALGYAKKHDVVVITGLGHQHTRHMNEGAVTWDDREVARQLLRQPSKS